MDEQRPKSLDEWIKHWDGRVKSTQQKAALSILVGILPGVLLFIIGPILFFLSDAVSGYFLLGGNVAAIGILLLLYNLWAKPNEKRVVRQLLDDIRHTCDAQGLSRAKVAEELAARPPSGSVRKAVIAGLDLEKDAGYPWLADKGSGEGSKFLGIAISAIFFGIMLFSAIVLLFNGVAVNTPTTLSTVGLGLGVVGWLIALLYVYTTSFDFRPGRQIPSSVLGQPFEARFSRLFVRRGTMQFDRDRLLLQTTRSAPSSGYGGGEGLLDDILSGEGLLGILLGALLAWIIKLLLFIVERLTMGKRFSISIAYSNIQSLSVAGRAIEISHSGAEPRRLRLKVASSDGARLYRELYHRYPSAISDWDDELREVFGVRLEQG